MNGNNIKIHYWKVSFKGKWSPQDVPRRLTTWVDELPKTCIILCSFSLTEDSKLLPSTRRHLQDEFARRSSIAYNIYQQLLDPYLLLGLI